VPVSRSVAEATGPSLTNHPRQTLCGLRKYFVRGIVEPSRVVELPMPVYREALNHIKGGENDAAVVARLIMHAVASAVPEPIAQNPLCDEPSPPAH
jgi:hypothetical protein